MLCSWYAKTPRSFLETCCPVSICFSRMDCQYSITGNTLSLPAHRHLFCNPTAASSTTIPCWLQCASCYRNSPQFFTAFSYASERLCSPNMIDIKGFHLVGSEPSQIVPGQQQLFKLEDYSCPIFMPLIEPTQTRSTLGCKHAFCVPYVSSVLPSAYAF